MTDVLVNQTKIGDRPAKKKEGQSVENQKLQTFEKIRPELNLEKWSIWQPAKSKNPPKRKTLKREITLSDGNKNIAKVEIDFTSRGVLDTDDQKVFYGFIKLWENAGKPTTPVFLSFRKLAKILGGKWGSNILKSLENSCFKLRGNLFIWENSFYNSETEEIVKIINTFNILSDLKLIKKERDGHITKEAGYFKFNDFILKNLLNNHTKPLYLDVILNFKSEIAQILYTHIDLIMANKTRYERRTQELFEDLNLEGKTYKNKSKRKEKLEPALKELLGVFLSTGVLIEARLEKTKDEKDYKVVLIKQSFSKSEEPTNRVGDGEEKKEQSLLTLPQPKPEVFELVKYFHQKLGRPNHEPSSKELDQATALFAECRFEKAKHVINFAINEAQTTNFQMRTFGAIFQYKNEALRLYERQRREQETLKIKQEREQKEKQVRAEQRRREKEELDNLYNLLTDEQKKKCQILIQEEFKKFFCPTQDPASPFYLSVQETAKYNVLRVLKQDSNLLN